MMKFLKGAYITAVIMIFVSGVLSIIVASAALYYPGQEFYGGLLPETTSDITACFAQGIAFVIISIMMHRTRSIMD